MKREEMAELLEQIVEQMRFLKLLGVETIAGESRLPDPAKLSGAWQRLLTSVEAGRPIVSAEVVGEWPSESPVHSPEADAGARPTLSPSANTPPVVPAPPAAHLMSSGETLANGPLSARVLSDPTPATLPARALFEMETKVTPMKPHTAMELLPANDTLEKIRLDLGECRRCRLCEKRKTIVFGCGAPRAELMLIGEGPGADEDDQGLPFVGRAGQLLTKILEAIQLTREAVYITNVIKCRPPQNRKPEADEVEPCHPFLLRQVKAIRPRLICALGATATQALLKTKESISSLRGRFFYFHGYKLIPTFHPAYLLRNPADKRLVWEDMQKVRDYLREQMPL